MAIEQWAGVTLALSLGVLAACGSGNDRSTSDVETGRPEGFAATPDYLSAVADKSADAAYDFEVTVDRDAYPVTSGLMSPSGRIDAQGQIYVRHNLEDLYDMLGGAAPSELEKDDFFVETIIDGSMRYQHSPALAPMFEAADGMLDDDTFFDTMREYAAAAAEGWVSVDHTALPAGVALPGPLSMIGMEGVDPRLYLARVREAQSVEEIDPIEIDGVEVVGLMAELTGDDGSAQVAVWFDGAGHVRRLTIDDTTIDFSGYGEDLDVEVPTNSTDMTASVLRLDD